MIDRILSLIDRHFDASTQPILTREEQRRIRAQAAADDQGKRYRKYVGDNAYLRGDTRVTLRIVK